jgi:hypothetical protein
MFGCNRKQARAASATGSDGVVEPDQRIVFGVLAVGMLVGALMTTPSKSPAQAKLQAPGAAQKLAAKSSH